MPEPQALLDAPLRVLEECFDRWVSANESPSINPDGDWGERQVFKEALGADGLLDRVPLLTKSLVQSGKLKPNTLVRYRGMVQDMFSESSTGRLPWAI